MRTYEKIQFLEDNALGCPFCGVKPAIKTGVCQDFGFIFYIECANSKCNVKVRTYPDDDGPLHAWNKRAVIDTSSKHVNKTDK